MLLLMGLDHHAFHIPADLLEKNRTRCRAGIANMVPMGLGTAAWRATMYGWPTRAAFDDDEESRRLDEQMERKGRKEEFGGTRTTKWTATRWTTAMRTRTAAGRRTPSLRRAFRRRRFDAFHSALFEGVKSDRSLGRSSAEEGRSHASVDLPPLPVSRAGRTWCARRARTDDADAGYLGRALKNPATRCAARCDRRGETLGEDGLVRCRNHATAARDLFARKWRRGVNGKLEHAVCSVCLSIDDIDEGSPVFRPKQGGPWVADRRRDVREGVGDFAPCVMQHCPHIACETSPRCTRTRRSCARRGRGGGAGRARRIFRWTPRGSTPRARSASNASRRRVVAVDSPRRTPTPDFSPRRPRRGERGSNTRRG